jgi:hypothetical protein
VRAVLPSRFLPALLIGLLPALDLAGCAPGAAIDELPSAVGLPSAAPSRPASPYKYPAVHDMPPDRASTPLSAEQQIKLEKDLQATRDRQAAKTSTGNPAPKPKSNAKDAKSGEKAGARTNP